MEKVNEQDMKKSDFMFPFISVASVHGAEVFRTHMLASLTSVTCALNAVFI